MGTATVTLTRKDTGAAISGATFELYKNGVLFETKATDSNGQLTFGDPHKLTAGNYYIKQISSADGLGTAVDHPFAILENGDPNQENNFTLVNDEVNRYYSLTFNSSANGLSSGPHYYKSGTVVTVTFDNGNDYFNPYDRIVLSGDITGTIGAYPNTRVFTVTMNSNKAVTLTETSYSNWDNVVNQSLKLSPNPERVDPTNLQSASTRSALSRITQLAIPKASVQSAEKPSEQALQPDVNVEQTANNALATRYTAITVNPSGPPSEDYIVDSSFTKIYTITKEDDNWKHVFENLDKCDLDENPYYYYVVETECVPATYHLASYSNDNLTDTGTIVITNEVDRGALTIQKSVTVNEGTVPNAAKTIADGDYTFSVTGPNNYSETITVTVSQGETASKTLSYLLPGTYTITETGTTNKNGINLVTTPVELVVDPGSQASANVASFTNNLETTSIKVKKQWMDANGRPVDNTTSVISFTLNQVSYVGENDSNYTEEPYAGDYTSQIVGNGEVEITNLPVKGTRADGTPVFYAYTIRENQDSISGYHDTYGTSEDGKTWTIYNTPAASTDQSDSLTVTKQWQDMDGNANNDLHTDDEITFTVTRHAVATTEYVPVTLSLFNSDSQGVVAQVKTYYVKKGADVTLRFYNGDALHFLTLSGAGSADRKYIGEDRPLGLYPCVATVRVNGPMNVSAHISDRMWSVLVQGSRIHDAWVDNAGHGTALPASTKWDYSISATGTNSIFEDAKDLAALLKNGEQLSNQPTYTYTMKGGNLITEGTDFNPQASNWVATLSDLPTYAKVGDHYETYTYTISEVKVNGKTVTYSESNAIQGSTEDYLVTIDPATNTITNKEKPVDLEFTKRWRDVASQVESWPEGKTIAITITATSSNDKKIYVYQIGQGDVASADTSIQAQSPANAPVLKVESIAENNYKFKLENLPRTDSSGNAYTYTISETSALDGYQSPAYFDSEGNPVRSGSTSIQSGGTIENSVAGFELPYTGGPGTGLVYLVGALLAALALVGLAVKWKRKTTQ